MDISDEFGLRSAFMQKAFHPNNATSIVARVEYHPFCGAYSGGGVLFVIARVVA